MERHLKLVSSHTSADQSNRRQIIVVALTMVLALISQTLLAAHLAPGNKNGGWQRNRAVKAPVTVSVESGEVKARIALSEAHVLSGKPVAVVVDFEVAPGWHVYGEPLPEEYTPTRVIFDNDLLSGQRLDFPKPTPVKFELLGDTLPVYQGRFKASGNIHVRQTLTPGEHRLKGAVEFQECNDNLCKMPQQVRFEIPLWIDSPTGPAEINVVPGPQRWAMLPGSVHVRRGR